MGRVGGCGGESFCFHVCRKGEGTAGVVGFTERPAVRKRGVVAPFTFGVTTAAGANVVAGTGGTGVFSLIAGVERVREVEFEVGKTTVDIDDEGADFWAVEDSASLPTRRRLPSVVEGVRMGESSIRGP